MSVINPTQLGEMCRFVETLPPGDIVEVGVYKGGSAKWLADVARAQARRLFLFDTFTGIPEQTAGLDTHKVGDFNETSVAEARANVGAEPIIVVGDARKTVPETDTGPLAFVHLDCDQYDTYRACIVELSSRMVRGGAMWFDDYDCLPGATRAVHEVFGDRLQLHDCGKSYVRF